ncbi:hypothetical protein R3P38DRAFT_3166134 [Favolaschia claudopus]|uniref:Uncharacterized protein n=1 Tax=Favolaschia claudopus TaxID=2862362 RepID=A0AAW0EKL5_9AGAR
MPRLLPRFVTRYRVGYQPTLPYRWPGTTPLAFLIMLTATILFILVNIPLSAYETVQEFTYFPNASAPAPPLSGLVPPSLRPSTNKFSPQHLDVGQSFRLNNSALLYTIVSAFDSVENGRPVTSFPYSNNPFSNGCDVKNISAGVQLSVAQAADLFQYYDYSVSGFITCTNPTLFEMGWNFNGGRLDTGISPSLLDDFGQDLREAAWYGVVGSHVDFTANFTGQAYIRVTARPCCNCTPDLTSDALEQDQLHLAQEPCRSEPSRFIGLTGQATNTTAQFQPWGFIWSISNTSSFFADADPRTQQGYIGINDLSVLNKPLQNIIQIIYHVVRRDLGVIYNNQIFGSADMFNQSIVPVDIPDNVIGIDNTPFGKIGLSMANSIRAATANETMMDEWRKSLALMTETDRVPVLEYLRPVPRRKALGSAIVSVFVATFTMLSAVWTVFHIIAGAFVRDKGSFSL